MDKLHINESLEKVRAGLIDLVDNQGVSMLKIHKDTKIAYQTIRVIVQYNKPNPNASTLRKLETYLNDNKVVQCSM